MSLRRLARKFKGLSVPLAVLLSLQGALYGQECASCGSGGCSTGSCGSTGGHCSRLLHCPPAYRHCLQAPPCIKFKYGCPLPVCPPCNAPNWGYYQPCWRPWPWPPNWNHCPYPVPATAVAPCPHGPTGPLGAPAVTPQALSTPRPLPGGANGMH
jgi:hypothetical protein